LLNLAIARVEAQALPAGVEARALRDHRDDRGTFQEIYRPTWSAQAPPAQWNMVRSEPNALRGVHAHVRHFDYITLAMGVMILGLHDPRRSSPSFGCSVLLRLEASDPHLLMVPPGVCHGFYFPEPSMHIYGMSETWDGTEEFGCAWDEPALGLGWPCQAPILSERDRRAGSYAELCAALQERGVA
jgi:dTDP-4-dehydrorhamnose 3,5-epimerase